MLAPSGLRVDLFLGFLVWGYDLALFIKHHELAALSSLIDWRNKRCLVTHCNSCNRRDWKLCFLAYITRCPSCGCDQCNRQPGRWCTSSVKVTSSKNAGLFFDVSMAHWCSCGMTVCLHLWLDYYVIWTCCACTFALFLWIRRQQCCQVYACQFSNIDAEYLDAALLAPTRGDDPTRGRTGAWNAVDAVASSSSTDALHWVCLRCGVWCVCAHMWSISPPHRTYQSY